jgi:hypothetical protein
VAKRDGTIEISGHTYKLKYIKDLKSPRGDAIWGYYKPQTGDILLEADQPSLGMRNTLVHEIVHGILEHAGLGTSDDNEYVASAIAYGLESVRVNGKKLLR